MWRAVVAAKTREIEAERRKTAEVSDMFGRALMGRMASARESATEAVRRARSAILSNVPEVPEAMQDEL